MPSIDPSPVARTIGPNDRRKSASEGSRRPIWPLHDVARLRVLQIAQDLGDAEHAHRQHREVDPVGQVLQPEREALLAGLEIGADRREQQAHHHHDDGLEHRAAREHDRKAEAEHHQPEILRRAEQQREPGQRRARSPR